MKFFFCILGGVTLVLAILSIATIPPSPSITELCFADLKRASRWARSDAAFESLTKEGNHICRTLENR